MGDYILHLDAIESQEDRNLIQYLLETEDYGD